MSQLKIFSVEWVIYDYTHGPDIRGCDLVTAYTEEQARTAVYKTRMSATVNWVWEVLNLEN